MREEKRELPRSRSSSLGGGRASVDAASGRAGETELARLFIRTLETDYPILENPHDLGNRAGRIRRSFVE